MVNKHGMINGLKTMNKEHGIFYIISYYNLVFYLIFALILYMTRDISLMYMCRLTHVTSERDYLFKLNQLSVAILLIGIWSFIFLYRTRGKAYKFHTGRSFSKDAKKYNRTYRELVDYFAEAEPQKMRIESLPTIDWTKSSGLIYGKVDDNGKERLISYEPKKNGVVSMIWGAPGDGKTTSTIITSARQFGIKIINGKRTQRGAVMVTDLKGDIYKANRKFRRIKRFSTIHWQNSYHYDPLITARKMDEDARCSFLDKLAVTLIPDESGADSVYFVKVARAFFTGIFMYILNEDINRPFPSICLDITTKSFDEWGSKIEASQYEKAIKYTNRFKRENPKNVGGGYSKLCDSLNLYTTDIMKTLLNNDDKCISPDDLENCIDIYVQVDPNEMDTVGGPVIALLYQVFMSQMLYRQEGQNPPIAFIIDEFGQIPAMPVIKKSAALMRAYNCHIMLACQSLAMIEEKYGLNGRKILMDCAKIHCFMSSGDPDTREWASRLIGTRKILKISNTLNSSKESSSSRSVSEAEEKCINPEHFGILPADDSLIIYYFGHYVKAKKTYYFGERKAG